MNLTSDGQTLQEQGISSLRILLFYSESFLPFSRFVCVADVFDLFKDFYEGIFGFAIPLRHLPGWAADLPLPVIRAHEAGWRWQARCTWSRIHGVPCRPFCDPSATLSTFHDGLDLQATGSRCGLEPPFVTCLNLWWRSLPWTFGFELGFEPEKVSFQPGLEP